MNLLRSNHACMSSMLSTLTRPNGPLDGQIYFVEQLRPRFGARVDQEIDDPPARRAAVIGLAIVARAAQVSEDEIARQLGARLCPIGVDQRDRDRGRPDQRIGIGERYRQTKLRQLLAPGRNGEYRDFSSPSLAILPTMTDCPRRRHHS
jgi:hypothetical protein